MDAGLKGRQVRGFDSRIRSADTFDLRACSRFWILFHVSRPGYKARDGLNFCLFWNFTKESFIPRKRPRRLRVRFLSLFLFFSLLRFAASLFPLFPSYFPRLATERCTRMNKGQRYVQDILLFVSNFYVSLINLRRCGRKYYISVFFLLFLSIKLINFD